jgi:crotonobetainyl-CoA:carnitine CoA-transferase CaiB-like acyl-CoA transferase
MGFQDDPPVGMITAHPDFSSNPHHAAVAILAALHYRNRTGAGQYIDLSQMESSAAFWGHALMEYTVNGRNPPRIGNRSPWSAPHGAYRCAPQGEDDDRWIALACSSEEHWRGVVEVLGGEIAADERFRTMADRLANVDALDGTLSRACRDWDAYELMQALQANAVPAGVVQNQRDLLENDPQLKAHGFYVWLDHSELGRIPHDGIPCVLSDTPAQMRRPAPMLGEDTGQVLHELLEMPWEEIAELASKGVLD